MTRDLIRYAGDHYLVDVTAQQHFAVPVGSACGSDRKAPTVPDQPLADRLRVATQSVTPAAPGNTRQGTTRA